MVGKAEFYKPYLRPINNLIRRIKRSDQRKAFASLVKFLHRDIRNLKSVPGVSAAGEFQDEDIIRRVVAAYRAGGDPHSAPTAIWEYIFNTQQAPLHAILMGSDEAAIRRLLRRPGDSVLFYGFEGGVSAASARRFRKNAGNVEVKSFSLPPHDHLIRFAEITGALRMENPERKSKAAYGLMSTDSILDAIDRRLSTRLDFPNPFPDEAGTLSSRGVITYRAVHAAYQAWQIRNLVAGIDNPRVLEIGGGLGRTAYYAWQMGIRDYTIIDLPFTAVSQGYFLMRTLGEDNVVLHGEGETGAGPRIRLLQPSAFLDSSDRYDVILNVDSLPEMDRPTADSYWSRIRKAAPWFLSINQEANAFTVQDLADADDVKPAFRYPSGLRKGYVEEIFRF